MISRNKENRLELSEMSRQESLEFVLVSNDIANVTEKREAGSSRGNIVCIIVFAGFKMQV
jgi:hypothetical protein